MRKNVQSSEEKPRRPTQRIAVMTDTQTRNVQSAIASRLRNRTGSKFHSANRLGSFALSVRVGPFSPLRASRWSEGYSDLTEAERNIDGDLAFQSLVQRPVVRAKRVPALSLIDEPLGG